MFENIKLAFQGIWGHKMRSLLTMLGIIIGIAAIISIVSTIKGTNEQIKKNLVGSGTNTVTVSLYQGDYQYEMDWGSIPDGVPVITEGVRSQVEALDTVSDVTLYHQRSYVSNIYYKNTSYSGAMRGVDQHYLKTMGYRINLGRCFTKRDFDNNNKVAILDESAAASLFGSDNPVGQILEIGGEPFTVIGTMAPAEKFEPVINNMNDYQMYMDRNNGMIIVPDTLWSMLYRYDEPQTLCLRATSTDDMTKAGQEAQKILNNRLTVSSDSNITYKSDDISEQAQNLQALSQTTNMQLLWIAGISLLVGGIGVMNIMLVSVTERTREIGLKKAIGAKESRILWQFLTEASVLTSMGGIIGVGGGIGLSRVIGKLTGSPIGISIPAILIAVLFSLLIGVIFGLLPAIKAAHLNPIDALRRE